MPIPRDAGPRGATGATGATGAAGPNSITVGVTSTDINGLIAGNGELVTTTASINLSSSLLVDNFGSTSHNWASRLLVNNIGETVLNYTSAVIGTLTAFAGVTLSANTLTIGTGSGTVSQTAFAANTFPARASTGSLEAKAITDFGLSLVDDADAATARATLGGTTVGQNIFTKANPSAVRFLRVNADNTIDFLTASEQDLAVGWNDPTEALRGSYHLLPMPSRPRWDIMENIPSSAAGTGWGMGGNDWNASTGNVLSHPGGRTGTNYGNNRARTHCIGPTPVAGTQMAQLRHGTRSPTIRSSVSDNFAYLIFRQRTLPALSQGWAGWKNLAAEHATTAVLQNTVNCIAMGYEQSGGIYEPNWYLYHNDGSGTCTRIDLGANFPTSIEAVYRFYICMEANSGNIAYQIDRLDVWATTSGLLNTNLPLIDNALFGHLYQSNGSTAVRCEVEAFHHFAAIKN